MRPFIIIIPAQRKNRAKSLSLKRITPDFWTTMKAFLTSLIRRSIFSMVNWLKNSGNGLDTQMMLFRKHTIRIYLLTRMSNCFRDAPSVWESMSNLFVSVIGMVPAMAWRWLLCWTIMHLTAWSYRNLLLRRTLYMDYLHQQIVRKLKILSIIIIWCSVCRRWMILKQNAVNCIVHLFRQRTMKSWQNFKKTCRF